jgi:hypothetical protein
MVGVKLRYARSALGPCHNGRAQAWAVTNGRLRFGGAAGRGPFGSCSWENAEGRFGLWSRRSGLVRRGSRRAATDCRSDQDDRSRIVADRRSRGALTPMLTCGFLSNLPDLYPSDVQAGKGAWDLTRKRTEVPTLPAPPTPLDQGFHGPTPPLMTGSAGRRAEPPRALPCLTKGGTG